MEERQVRATMEEIQDNDGRMIETECWRTVIDVVGALHLSCLHVFGKVDKYVCVCVRMYTMYDAHTSIRAALM